MPQLRVANTPQTRLLHVVCDMVLATSSVVTDMGSNMELAAK